MCDFHLRQYPRDHGMLPFHSSLPSRPAPWRATVQLLVQSVGTGNKLRGKLLKTMIVLSFSLMVTAISVTEGSTLLWTMIQKVRRENEHEMQVGSIRSHQFTFVIVFIGNFRFVSLQSKVGQSLLLRSGRSPDDISSIVVCTKDGQAFVESDAILKIAQGLSGPLPAFGTVGFVVPPVIRDALYKVVSENRFRFGESEYEQCRLDYDGEYDNRFVPDP